jgi:hypothetical protein
MFFYNRKMCEQHDEPSNENQKRPAVAVWSTRQYTDMQCTLACTTTNTAGVAGKPPFLKRTRLALSLSVALPACPTSRQTGGFKRAPCGRAVWWCRRVVESRKQPQWRHAPSRRGRASCPAPRRRRRSGGGQAVTKAKRRRGSCGGAPGSRVLLGVCQVLVAGIFVLAGRVVEAEVRFFPVSWRNFVGLGLLILSSVSVIASRLAALLFSSKMCRWSPNCLVSW